MQKPSLSLAISLFAAGSLAACSATASPTTTVDAHTLVLPERVPGSSEASDALIPQLIEDLCLPAMADGQMADRASQLGLERANLDGLSLSNFVSFEADTYTSTNAPRVFIKRIAFPDNGSARRGCTLAIFDWDLQRAVDTAVATFNEIAEAAASKGGGASAPDVSEMTAQSQVLVELPAGDRVHRLIITSESDTETIRTSMGTNSMIPTSSLIRQIGPTEGVIISLWSMAPR